MAERRGSGLQSRIRGFESHLHLVAAPASPWAIGAAVARFPDTEEVTGSIPVSPTSSTREAVPVPTGAASRVPGRPARGARGRAHTPPWTGCGTRAKSRLVCGTRRNAGDTARSPSQTGRADVAQLVEHHLAKVRVAGSSPVIRSEAHSLAGSLGSEREDVSHTVEWPRGEAAACKAVYVGSNPISTSRQHPRAIGAAVARFPDTEEVTGSIPVSPTSTARRPPRTPSGAAFVVALGSRA